MIKKAFNPIALAVLFLASSNAAAFTIKEGTVTAGGSSNIFFENRNYDTGRESREYSTSIRTGYFVKDNSEAEMSISYDYFRYDTVNNKAWSISPSYLYHLPTGEKDSVFGGAEILFTEYDIHMSTGLSTHQESFGYGLIAGWEYFFSASAALNLRLTYDWIGWTVGGSSVYSNREDRLTGRLGFDIFF